MRVALIGPLPPPSGGMANQAIQTREMLEGAGMVVRFVRVNEPYRPAWIGRVRGVRALFRLSLYVLELWRKLVDVDLVHVMANSGWSWHLYAAPAVWIAHARSKPVVVNYRGGEAQRFFDRQWRWIRPTLAMAASVVVPSPFLEKVFKERGIACSIVPNVLDTARFYPSDRERAATGSPHVVVTRNLEPIYDVATAIRAFHMVAQRYSGARLTIAGSGPEEAKLRALADQLMPGGNVSFSGRRANEEVAELYRSADLMLNASVEDNSPNSLIEALACGVPVVSTAAGGIPLLVKHRVSAMLVPVRDHKALGTAAIEVLEDDQLRHRIIGEGRRAVRAFEKGHVLTLWQQHYLGLVPHIPGGSLRAGRHG